MIVFYDTTPCILEEIYPRFGGAYCLHRQGGELFTATFLNDMLLVHFKTHSLFDVAKQP
jgi:hypothetical protein